MTQMSDNRFGLLLQAVWAAKSMTHVAIQVLDRRAANGKNDLKILKRAIMERKYYPPRDPLLIVTNREAEERQKWSPCFERQSGYSWILAS